MRFLLPLLLACGPSDPPPTTADSTTDSASDTGRPDPGTTLPEHHGVVTGVVTDASDQPLESLTLTLCGGICQVAQTDATGAFRFEGVWPQANVLESVSYPGADQAEDVLHWARFFDLVSLTEGQQIALDHPMRMHPITPARALSGPQDLEVSPGLRVAFDADLIGVEHVLPSPAEEVALGAVELPPEDWPRALGDWTGVKGWGFAVWDLEIDDGFAATVTLTEPLPAGHEAAFLVADYVTGFRDGVLAVEPAELDPNRLTVRTPASGGIDRTTLWVLATRPL